MYTVVETPAARYVIVQEDAIRRTVAGRVLEDHWLGDSSFLAEKPQVIVTELRIPSSLDLLYDSRYPSQIALIPRFSPGVWNTLQNKKIPIAVMEPAFESEQYNRLISEIDTRLAKLGKREAKLDFLAKLIAGSSAAGLALQAGYNFWKRSKQKEGKTSKTLSRRAFLAWVGGMGFGLALTKLSPSLVRGIADKSIFMHEGRSAWTVNTCNEVLAPFLRKEYKLKSGQKPTIVLPGGTAHLPLLEDYLKHPAKCDSVLKKFYGDYSRSVPRWRDNVFFFRFGRNGRLQRQDIPITRHLWDFSFGPRRQESLAKRPPQRKGKNSREVVLDRRKFLRLPRSRLRRV
ncbi:hypothetical protein KJ972_05555 [Candidatus Micrarchaeota archaeon]|nr:hypothetical protein [Candidatus Micrarchaeota archaeon]